MPSSVTGIGAMTGAGVTAVPASVVPGGLQNASMAASIEIGKKRMRDTNDDLLMVPLLLHEYTFFSYYFLF